MTTAPRTRSRSFAAAAAASGEGPAACPRDAIYPSKQRGKARQPAHKTLFIHLNRWGKARQPAHETLFILLNRGGRPGSLPVPGMPGISTCLVLVVLGLYKYLMESLFSGMPGISTSSASRY